MVKHFWEQWLLPAGSDGGRLQHHEQPCAAPPCPPSLPMQAKSSQPDSRIETFLVVESRLSTFVLFYFFGQSANTFYDFNRGCYHPIVFKWTKKLVSINPILPVSRSIKGGAGDIQTPSLSRTENKFSTRRQSWSKWLKVVATRTKTSRLKIVTSRTKNLI